MPRKVPDLDRNFDFHIYTDPSCLNEAMEGDIPPPPQETQSLEEEGSIAERSPEVVVVGEAETERAEPTDIPGEEPTEATDIPQDGVLDAEVGGEEDYSPAEGVAPEERLEGVPVEDAPTQEEATHETPTLESEEQPEQEPQQEPEPQPTQEPEEQPAQEPDMAEVTDEPETPIAIEESALEHDIDALLEEIQDAAADDQVVDEQEHAQPDTETVDDIPAEESTAAPAVVEDQAPKESALDAVEDVEQHEEDIQPEKDVQPEEGVQPEEDVHPEEDVQPELAAEDDVPQEATPEDEVQPEAVQEDEAHEESLPVDEVPREVAEDTTAEGEVDLDVPSQPAEDDVAQPDEPAQVEEADHTGEQPSQEDEPIPELEPEVTELETEPQPAVEAEEASLDELSIQPDDTAHVDDLPVDDLAVDDLDIDDHLPQEEDDTTAIHPDFLLEQEQDQDALLSLALSSPTSHPSDRRATSLRTEALIQAAARAVVAKIEERAVAAVHRRRNSQKQQDLAGGGERSLPQHHRAGSPELSRVHLSPTSWRRSRPNSPGDAGALSRPASRTVRRRDGGREADGQAAEAEGDGEEYESSSPHEVDSDVFSDRSARSSIASFEATPPAEGESERDTKTPVRDVDVDADGYGPAKTARSPRVSGVSSVSMISGISAYEREEEYEDEDGDGDEDMDVQFGGSSPRKDKSAPRMPFRTPSSVRALQMSSPTPSVFNGASPRSRRSGGGGNGGLTVASAQYSPKGRTTPPRLKSRKEAPPLVLLHVTLLPLRWMWGEVVDGLDVARKDGFEGADDGGLSALRDAWRQLQDRVGDTVLERGVLLPHPQNDYEVLEERLLEALELPLRRRARILECGHYLGPANEDEEEEEEDDDDDTIGESESEDEYGHGHGWSERQRRRAEKKHWCGTCQGDIRFEALGPGKAFRIKVYASNGLMKAGAWEACWKEMERVDVEVEPIVDTPLQRELERLSAFQIEEEDRRRDEEDMAIREKEMMAEDMHLLPSAQEAAAYHHDHLSSPPALHASPPSPMALARSPTPFDNSEARRLRDEARMREIYGLPPVPALTADVRHPSEAEAEPAVFEQAAPSSPPRAEYSHPDPEESSIPSSPAQQEADARRTHRRTASGTPYESASLPELMLESVRVLLRDRKNVAIVVLSLFVLFLAVRPKEQAGLEAYRVDVPVEQGYRFEMKEDPATEARKVEEGVRQEIEMALDEAEAWLHTTISSGSEAAVEAAPSVEAVEEATVSNDSEETAEASPVVEVAEDVSSNEVVDDAFNSEVVEDEATSTEVVDDAFNSEVVEDEATSTEVVDDEVTSTEVVAEATSSAEAVDAVCPFPEAVAEPTCAAESEPLEEDATDLNEAVDAPETETSTVEAAPTADESALEPTLHAEAMPQVDESPDSDASSAETVTDDVEPPAPVEMTAVEAPELCETPSPALASAVPEEPAVDPASDPAPTVCAMPEPESSSAEASVEAVPSDTTPVFAATDAPSLETASSEQALDADSMSEDESASREEAPSALPSSCTILVSESTPIEPEVGSSEMEEPVPVPTSTSPNNLCEGPTSLIASPLPSSLSVPTAAAPETTVTERTVVRVFETVTETVRVSVTATELV